MFLRICFTFYGPLKPEIVTLQKIQHLESARVASDANLDCARSNNLKNYFIEKVNLTKILQSPPTYKTTQVSLIINIEGTIYI